MIGACQPTGMTSTGNTDYTTHHGEGGKPTHVAISGTNRHSTVIDWLYVVDLK